jgi:pyridinium-3,5-bisthiocarboxylic acid mononucleotide nickel chelatase
MLAETTTLGVRLSRRERVVALRRMVTFETKFGPLLMKVKELAGRQVAAPEYEDAARLARERGVPLAEVYRAAAAVEVPNA